MPDNITHDSSGTSATSQPGSWMLYGAAGYTGAPDRTARPRPRSPARARRPQRAGRRDAG